MNASEIVQMILRHAGAAQVMTSEQARTQARASRPTTDSIAKALDAYVDARIEAALQRRDKRGTGNV